MAYQKKIWADRQSEYPNRRGLRAVEGADNVYEIRREEGLVVEEGDPFDQMNMNALEGRVEAAFGELMNGTVKAAKAATADNATKAYGKAESALSVSYAASAGSAKAVAWGNVSGKPGFVSTVTYSATIGTAWSGSKPWTQNVAVGGILASDNPAIDAALSGTAATDIARLEAWGSVSRIVTYNGGITVTCYEQAPTAAIPIQIKAVR